MQEVLMQEMFKGSVVKKEDAHVLFKVDPAKVDTVYDMVTKKLGNNEEAPTV
jgi:transcriptional adapter 2-alpha